MTDTPTSTPPMVPMVCPLRNGCSTGSPSTCLFAEYCAWAAAQPPAPKPQQEPERVSLDGGDNLDVRRVADTTVDKVTHTAPEQPGDAERAAEAYRETMRSLFGKVPSSQYYAVHAAFKTFADAAQSALAEKEAEVARLKELCNGLEIEASVYAGSLARLRSPTATATGEDRLRERIKQQDITRGRPLTDSERLANLQAEMDRYDEEEKQAIATALAQGEQRMRAAVLRYHDEQRIKHRDAADRSGIRGACMAAHEESIDAIRVLVPALPSPPDDGGKAG